VVVNNADGTAPADTTNPRISAVRVGGGTVSFRLSESAKVELRVQRGAKTLKRKTASGKAGANKVKLPKLAPGRYKLRLKATDLSANRNFSEATKSFTVKR
jgi:hypothetical protein